MASDVAIAPDGSKLFVTAMGTHNVFVINTSSDKISNVIDLWQDGTNDSWPLHMAITPGGDKLYIANAIGGNITVVSTGSERVVGHISAGHAIRNIATVPGKPLAYAILGNETALVINTTDDQVTGSIRTPDGNYIFTLVATHDGRFVYLVGQNPARIYKIDTGDASIIDSFDVGRGITNQGLVSISADDSKLYLPCGVSGTTYAQPDWGDNRVYVVDLNTHAVSAEIGVRGGPIVVRIAPNGSIGYVSTFAARSIYAVNLDSNEVIGPIDINGILAQSRLTDLRNSAITPDGKKLYVACWDADGIAVADLGSQKLTSFIPFKNIHNALFEIALSDDGSRLYVSSQDSSQQGGTLYVVDAATRSVIDKIRGQYPANPTMSSDGKTIYAVAGGNVLAIDVATDRTVNTLQLSREPNMFYYDIALIPGQQKAYVTNPFSRNVTIVDLQSFTETGKIDAGWYNHMITVTLDGRTAYVSRQNNPYDLGGLTIIDTANDSVIGTIDVPEGEMGTNGRHGLLTISPDGKYVYWLASSLVKIDTATNKVVKVTSLNDKVIDTEWGSPRGLNPSDMAFTSDGRLAYIPCGDAYYLIVYDIASDTVIDRLYDMGVEPVSIILSKDDHYAYLTNMKSPFVSVVDLQSRALVDKIFLE